jgi:hypothetical protein
MELEEERSDFNLSSVAKYEFTLPVILSYSSELDGNI